MISLSLVHFQLCDEILRALSGKLVYGIVPEEKIKSFREKCKKLFPRAYAFLTDEEKKMNKNPTCAIGQNNDCPINGIGENAATNKPCGDMQGSNNKAVQSETKTAAVKTEKIVENGTVEVKENNMCVA